MYFSSDSYFKFEKTLKIQNCSKVLLDIMNVRLTYYFLSFYKECGIDMINSN